MINTYDSIAPYYDEIMGDRSETVRHISNLMTRYNPNAKTILELGCGTGQIISELMTSYAVYGIDESHKMLEIARAKGLNVSIGNITNFDLHKTYDVVICIFDTINHLDSDSLWLDTFSMAKKHLNTGGVFIFDYVTLGRFEEELKLPIYSAPMEKSEVNITAKQLSNNMLKSHIQVDDFGSGVISETTVTEITYPLEHVHTLINKVFFKVYTSCENGSAPDDLSERVYFTCLL